MSSVKKTSKIYVDIQSLLDVRQAILSKLMNIDDLVEYLNSDKYNFRELDEFPVNMTEYKNIENNNDVSILKRTTVTYIISTIQTKLTNLEKRNNYYGETRLPEVVLNIYPYALKEDHVEVLQNILFIKLGSNCLITIINKEMSEITPYFIKSLDIVAVFIYDFSSWLNKHTDAVREVKLPDVLFYFPSLYMLKVQDNESEKITKTGFKDLFSYLEFMFSSVMNINFLPIIFYTNIVTASVTLDKCDDTLKDFNLTDEAEKDGDIGAKV